MNTTNAPYGTVYMPIDGIDPQVVNETDERIVCVELNPTVGYLHFCLTGTADELHWLCDKLRAVVTAHESATKLAGEAAARVAGEWQPVDAADECPITHDRHVPMTDPFHRGECVNCGERFAAVSS